MIIDQHGLAQYRENGFFVQNDIFAPADLQQLVDSLDVFAKEPMPGHVKEKNSNVYRAFHGCHLYSQAYRELIRLSLIHI